MKRLLFYTFTFLNLFSFSQQVAIYDFENLPEGNVDGQDGWQYSSSLSSIDNGYNCPVIGTPLITQVSFGNYQAGKAIRTGSGWDIQSVLFSRKNNTDWSFPSLQNKKFIMFEFVMGWGCTNISVKLVFDENMNGKLIIEEKQLNLLNLNKLSSGSYLVRIKYWDKTTDIQLIMKQLWVKKYQ